MPEMIVRKCTVCKESIEISRSDLTNVIYYDKAYYHKACFCERAEKRSQSKCKKQKEWQSALNNISELEIDTKRMLKSSLDQGDLNEWLLQHYDISVVPKRFWQIVADLERGTYKGKKCKPISIKILHEAWQWGQHKLNKINVQNKMNHKGPTNDEGRILYDLAILVGKIPNYLAHKSKLEAQQAEAKKETKINHINYDSMIRTEIKQEGLDDISALLDEF